VGRRSVRLPDGVRRRHGLGGHPGGGRAGVVVAGLASGLLGPDTAQIVGTAGTVTPAGASKSRNSPFAGLELPGRVVATFLRGVPTVLDGKLA